MTRRAILASVCFLAATALLLSQTLHIDVGLRSNEAGANASGKVFWSEGTGPTSSGPPDSFADLAERFSPAVVNIQTERTSGSRIGSPEVPGRIGFRRRPNRRQAT